MNHLELTLLYLVKNDCVLLAMKKRGFGAGMWNGVGGKVNPNESVESALIRECQEEIGVKPTSYKKVGYLIFNEIHDAERKIMNLHIYCASEWQNEPTESEEMRPQWFTINQLPLETMWPADSQWLPQVLGGELVEGTFTLDEDNKVTDASLKIVKELQS